MSLKKVVNIIGFQHEPEVLDNHDSNTVVNYDADDEQSQHSVYRAASNISTWCECGKCYPMPSQRECKCCHELDEIKFNLLGGKSLMIIYLIAK